MVIHVPHFVWSLWMVGFFSYVGFVAPIRALARSRSLQVACDTARAGRQLCVMSCRTTGAKLDSPPWLAAVTFLLVKHVEKRIAKHLRRQYWISLALILLLGVVTIAIYTIDNTSRGQIDLPADPQYYYNGECRFFIGSRTHSIVAALSSGVPTISIAYSVKAKGINHDLFGYYRYVLDTPEVSRESLTEWLTRLWNEESGLRSLLVSTTEAMGKRTREALRRLAQDLKPRWGQVNGLQPV